MNDEVKKLLNDLADMTCPILRETGRSCLDNKEKFRCMSCRSKVLLKDRVTFTEGFGRTIVRNGVDWAAIDRYDPRKGGPTPTQMDAFTKRIIHLLNVYGEE